MKRVLTLAVAAALAGSAAMTHAYEAGDVILRVGAATVAPDADSDVVPGLGVTVDVDDNTQLGIIPVYMVDPNWGIELLAATPFKHDIDVNELPIKAGSTKHLPPTLTVQWYPRGDKSGWQPYLGVGVNYTYATSSTRRPAVSSRTSLARQTLTLTTPSACRPLQVWTFPSARTGCSMRVSGTSISIPPPRSSCATRVPGSSSM